MLRVGGVFVVEEPVVGVGRILDGVVVAVGVLWYVVWFIGWSGAFSRIVCGRGV